MKKLRYKQMNTQTINHIHRQLTTYTDNQIYKQHTEIIIDLWGLIQHISNVCVRSACRYLYHLGQHVYIPKDGQPEVRHSLGGAVPTLHATPLLLLLHFSITGGDLSLRCERCLQVNENDSLTSEIRIV